VSTQIENIPNVITGGIYRVLYINIIRDSKYDIFEEAFYVDRFLLAYYGVTRTVSIPICTFVGYLTKNVCLQSSLVLCNFLGNNAV